MNISDLMSPQVVVAKENTNAEKISFRLVAGDINGMPVVEDNGAVVGMVTALDILRASQGGNKKAQYNDSQGHYDAKSISYQTRYANGRGN